MAVLFWYRRAKREELIAYKHSKKEICELLGADSLEYLKIERLSQLVNNIGICKGCFTGKYPVKVNKNKEVKNDK